MENIFLYFNPKSRVHYEDLHLKKIGTSGKELAAAALAIASCLRKHFSCAVAFYRDIVPPNLDSFLTINTFSIYLDKNETSEFYDSCFENSYLNVVNIFSERKIFLFPIVRTRFEISQELKN